MSTSNTGIELRTKYFILSFLIVIFPVTITIDGQATKGKWGSQFIALAPGSHTMEVSWKFYWLWPANKATTTVNVVDGQVTRVTYDTLWYGPMFWGLPAGKITVGV